MRNFLLALTILFGTISWGQKNQSSLLWEISGNGLAKPSYLYGTMHVSNKIAFHLGDTFFMALDRAELVCLESDPSKWIEHMYDSPSGRTLNGYADYLTGTSSGNFYENLLAVNAPEKKTLEYALRKKHALENGFLYRGSAFNDEFEENTYLDLFIFQYAKKNNKPVLNLEQYEETNLLQIKSLFPDKDEDDKKLKKNYHSSWNKDMSIREAMEEAYRNGDIQVIDSITKMTAQSENYLHYFLHERNRIMAEGIDTLSRKQSIFIGIGAAHLPGEKGVIQMLKDKGFKLRPIKRKITKLAKTKKNKIEEQFLKQPYKSFTTADGYISVKVPGKLYETPGEHGDIQYFYPDMANGGYFFVSRFQTFSPLKGMNATKWEMKVDSLLFENIEGKILKQEKKKVSGYNAIDVLNKTRKGDYQRRLIVFTPLEVIFFKVSGTGKWALDHGGEFIESVQFNYSEEPTLYTSHLMP